MMINLTDMKIVRSILGRHGFHFSKKLGQNFLIDPSVCPRIAEEGNAAAGYGVLEIGPGIGTLTQQLALRAEKVTSVELDQRLLPITPDRNFGNGVYHCIEEGSGVLRIGLGRRRKRFYTSQ